MSYNYQPPRPPYEPDERGRQSFFNSIRSWRIRREPDRWIGGVASGAAVITGLDVNLIRGLMFIFAILNPRVMLFAYAALWALVPERTDNRIHLEEFIQARFDIAHLGVAAFAIFGFFWPISIEYKTGDGWIGGLYGAGGTVATFFLVAAAVLIIILMSKRKQHEELESQYGPRSPHGQAPESHGIAFPSREDGFRFDETGNAVQPGETSLPNQNQQEPNAPAWNVSDDAPEHEENIVGPAPTNAAFMADQTAWNSNQPAAPLSGPEPRQIPYAPYGQPAPLPPYPTRTRPQGPGVSAFLGITGSLFLVTALTWLLWRMDFFTNPGIIATSVVGVAFIITGMVLGVRALQGKQGTWLTALSIAVTVLVPGFMLIVGSTSAFMAF